MSKTKKALPVVESPSLQPHLDGANVASSLTQDEQAETLPPWENPPEPSVPETPVKNDTPVPIKSKLTSEIKFPVKYAQDVSVEAATPDEQNVPVKTLKEYVNNYYLAVSKTARSIMEMCRIVYEAHRSLDAKEFVAFCTYIGFKEGSSTVRKYTAIGKLYSRFIPHVDELPDNWTSIYLLTQIPEKRFKEIVSEQSLVELKGSELAKLAKQTREIYSIGSVLRESKKSPGTTIGTFMFTKWSVDDIDWRAMKKAISELEARLPLRFLINHEAECVFISRKDKRYEQTKRDYAMIEAKPDRWDFGREANLMAIRPEVIGGEKQKPGAQPEENIGDE